MYLSISPSRSWYYYPDLVCSVRILLWFPRRAQKRPRFSPKAHFQESACVKLQCSRRCPTFKLHSSPWDCFWPLTKGERACVWVSRGVCICASRLYRDACSFASTPAFPNQRACVCVHVRGGLEDYKEEVNGKYTLGDKVRGRHSIAAPPLSILVPSFFALPPLWQGPWENQTGGLGLAGKLAGPRVGRPTGCWGLSKALRPSFRPVF